MKTTAATGSLSHVPAHPHHCNLQTSLTALQKQVSFIYKIAFPNAANKLTYKYFDCNYLEANLNSQHPPIWRPCVAVQHLNTSMYTNSREQFWMLHKGSIFWNMLFSPNYFLSHPLNYSCNTKVLFLRASLLLKNKDKISHRKELETIKKKKNIK